MPIRLDPPVSIRAWPIPLLGALGGANPIARRANLRGPLLALALLAVRNQEAQHGQHPIA